MVSNICGFNIVQEIYSQKTNCQVNEAKQQILMQTDYSRNFYHQHFHSQPQMKQDEERKAFESQ